MPQIPVLQVNSIIAGNGTYITWWQKSTGSADPFDTGSTITYGYGDPQLVLTSGSFYAVVMPVKPDEEIIEPGFILEDYRNLFYSAGDSPAFFDWVTFDGQAWRVKPTQTRLDAGNVIFQKASVRTLVPSGSLNIFMNYVKQLNP